MDASAPFSLSIPAHLINETDLASDRLLCKLFLQVNRKFFKNGVQAEIRWEVPRPQISNGTLAENGRELPNEINTHLTELLQQKQFSAAIPLLQPYASTGNSDAQLLLAHLLKQLGMADWQLWAQRHNNHLHSAQTVPAASYCPDQRWICVHPYLRDQKAPQWVLKYLIYQACCQHLILTEWAGASKLALAELEARAPNRERAITWLQNEGFPTLGANDELLA
jgi:hypothetical protein